jgi:hypothetical protein
MCFERLQERHRELSGDAFRTHKHRSNRLDHAGIMSKVKGNAVQILECRAVKEPNNAHKADDRGHHQAAGAWHASWFKRLFSEIRTNPAALSLASEP